jgi:hypothetical protein
MITNCPFCNSKLINDGNSLPNEQVLICGANGCTSWMEVQCHFRYELKKQNNEMFCFYLDGGEFTATGDEFQFKVRCGGEPIILIEPPDSGLSKVLDFYNNYKASKLFI